MSKISVMPIELANKIAAGEVVEKCMNIVKELVENSVDAKASSISIKLIDGGIKSIEVKDDGVGMDREDATLAFSRHATSKIRDIDDLFYIESLGFRGEALPSIASISKLLLKTSDGVVGTEIILNGGEVVSINNSDLVRGTTIRVTDLFYNTPVRLKYLKNQYSELANILEYVNKMALSYPSIKFELYNNDKLLFNTTGTGDLLKVIYDIYGADITRKMIPINGENDDYVISGYMSYPEVTKSSKNAITILINGRVIKNYDVIKSIISSYHTYVHEGRYPIVVLQIDVDPILIDVNIHPTKQDIKFSKSESLKEVIIDSFSKRLKEIMLIPDANVRTNSAISEVRHQINIASNKEVFVPSKNYEEIKLDFEVNEKNVEYEEKDDIKIRIKKMNPIAIIEKTYIVAENEDGMYLCDQHAVAERINYEKMFDKMVKEQGVIVDLLTPIRVEYPYDEAIILKKNIDLVKEIGIGIEEFGDNSFIIRSHPTWIPDNNTEGHIRTILETIINNQSFSKEKFIDKAATSIACHMSVKAHTYISMSEAEYLLDKIRYCKNPFTCPHGRPSIIAFSSDELKKMFKRDYNE